jgi:hypothetical protein
MGAYSFEFSRVLILCFINTCAAVQRLAIVKRHFVGSQVIVISYFLKFSSWLAHPWLLLVQRISRRIPFVQIMLTFC